MKAKINFLFVLLMAVIASGCVEKTEKNLINDFEKKCYPINQQQCYDLVDNLSKIETIQMQGEVFNVIDGVVYVNTTMPYPVAALYGIKNETLLKLRAGQKIKYVGKISTISAATWLVPESKLYKVAKTIKEAKMIRETATVFALIELYDVRIEEIR